MPGLATGYVPLDREAGWAPDFAAAPRDDVAAVFLNFPSNPCAVCVPDGTFAAAVEYANQTGAVVVHDFAYGDIVFDGRAPRSFLAEPGAREVGVEMFSMSKTYGMAGWRLGFVVGNAEIVARLDLLADHVRVGIFSPVQQAGIAALTGPQDSVAERVETYRRRRDRVREVLPHLDGRGLVLPLVGAAGRPDAGAAPGRAPGRGRARRGLRLARRGLGAALARGHGRSARDRARSARGGSRLVGDARRAQQRSRVVELALQQDPGRKPESHRRA